MSDRRQWLAKVLTITAMIGTLAVLSVGCGNKTASSAARARTSEPRALTAVYIKTAPVMDGRQDEVWSKGVPVTLNLKGDAAVEPKQVTVRALYTDTEIFLLASYRDSTPLKLNRGWRYEGGRWVRGSYDDTLAFLWNMNDSIKDFNERGFNVVNAKPGVNDDVYDFKIIRTNEADEAAFAAQQGDLWSWCMVPEYYFRAGDFVFRAEPKIAGRTREITVQHDYRPNKAPWFKNEKTVNVIVLPKYMLKPGLTDTPWPYEDEVVEITDSTVFRDGDTAPAMIMKRDVKWGGSKDDVSAKATWTVENGWLVEFSRVLNTGWPDDVKFNAADREVRYTFGTIVRDGGNGYAYGEPVSLLFAGNK